MKKKWIAVLLMSSMLAGMLTGCSVSGSSELLASEIIQGDKDITPVVTEPVENEDALWTFSYNMLKENLEETNPVLSPMSVYLAMGMVGLGAKGDTLTEFENVMGKGLQNTAGTLMKDLPTWLNDTREEKKSVLNVANAVWVDDTMNPDEGWAKNVADIYAAEAYRGVLSSAGVQKDINKWVEKKTNSLIKEFLSEPLDNGSSELMKLKLPKFEVEFDKILNETLQNMGIKKAFDEQLADFNGLGYTENGVPLYISLVRQKAVVKLDEEGTEAAAVTMVVMDKCAMAMPEKQPMEVYFDEPFLYMVMDMESKTPLFIGVMDNPVE